MTDYTKNTNFGAKDLLVTGDPAKRILGSAYDSEFEEIETAIASKIDSSQKGAANGVAPLDSSGLLDDSYLPLVVASGSWSPTVTGQGGSQHASVGSVLGGRYIRIGDVVHFSGHLSGTANGTGGTVAFTMSPPVASALSSTFNVTGAVTCYNPLAVTWLYSDMFAWAPTQTIWIEAIVPASGAFVFEFSGLYTIL